MTPIGFTRLRSEVATHAKDVPSENAFAFHVVLKPVTADLWIDGKHVLATRALPGETFFFSLSQNPTSQYHTSFDNLRFYISQTSLDELAYDDGARKRIVFGSRPLGAPDGVMHGLAMALSDRVEHPNERSALFIDHIALAFHAHITEVYGAVAVPNSVTRDNLAPWQLRRSLDFMLANLDGDPSIADVARECNLSSGHFLRTFRRTTGATPHQWLIRRRVERARDLLLRGRLGLAEIAVTCGFADQSHFTRVFAKIEGQSPGNWRRLNRTSVF